MDNKNIPVKDRLIFAMDVPDCDRARALADELGMDLFELASGVATIAEFQMADLIRKVTVQKGLDPREFVVFAFGGAGPVHMGRARARSSIAPPAPHRPGCASP